MNNPDTSSAEWIAEAPAAEQSDGSLQILPLANFGRVTFTNASATAGGHTGSVSDPAWTLDQVDMSNAGGAELPGGGSFTPAGLGAAGSQQSPAGATTGGVSSDGASFTVSYTSDSTAGQSSNPASTGSGGGSGYGYPGSYGYPGGYGYSGGYVVVSPGGYLVYVQ